MNFERKVSDLMTKEVIYVHKEDRMGKILEILQTERIHHILVKDKNKLVGVISQADVLKLYEKRHRDKDQSDLTAIKAHDIMTANPLTIESEDTVGLAADIFLTNKLHSLPVVDDGDLVGIVTSHDLLKYAYYL